MRNKFWELLNLTWKAKQQGIGMQRRLLVYWISMMLVVFATFLVLLSAAGAFSDSEEKLQQILCIQQKTMVTDLNTQLGRLTAQGIRFSEDASAILEDHLFASSIQTLNNNPEQLRLLEEELYIKLKTALQSNPCNGIWVLLDATTNTAAKGAEDSRAGLLVSPKETKSISCSFLYILHSEFHISMNIHIKSLQINCCGYISFNFYLFICLIWLCQVLVVTCTTYFPDQGSNPSPLHCEPRVLTTGPPRKPLTPFKAKVA